VGGGLCWTSRRKVWKHTHTHTHTRKHTHTHRIKQTRKYTHTHTNTNLMLAQLLLEVSLGLSEPCLCRTNLLGPLVCDNAHFADGHVLFAQRSLELCLEWVEHREGERVRWC
jgi:hypothetical protein